MFTNSFKVLIGLIVALVIIMGIVLTEVNLTHRVILLEERPQAQVQERAVVVPTATPSATPTAMLKFVPRTTTIAPTK